MTGEFVPLRTDPPPSLGSTLWTRSALVLAIAAAAGAVLVAEYRGGPGTRLATPLAIVLHGAVVVLLVVWSATAIGNVSALVPSTRYGHPASGRLAAALWIAATAALVAALVVVDRAGAEFANDEAVAPTLLTIVVVVVAMLVAWSPIGYHVRQARRIGAPQRTIAAWYWWPLGTYVTGLAIVAFAVAPRVGSDAEAEVTRVGSVYGLAAMAFAWSTWRAVTVFDEVIDLRWNRWRTDWEQTLRDLAQQPPPGPERGATT